MGKTQTCILCEIVYNSKQEMDEHMRSMLHHRELENLKGRDCGHECRTCGVTVLSLTEYANHISSPVHKQRVEDHNRQASSTKQDEEYFDKEMIELIEKRKEFIRQEEAALRRVREEKELEKKWQDMENQWQNQRPWLQQQGASWGRQHPDIPLSSRSRGPTNRQEQRTGPNLDRSNWNSRQHRSATWHAEGPPDLQRWESFKGRGGSLHNQGNYWGGRQSTWGGFLSHQRKQSFWVNKEPNKGNYERSNDFHCQRPQSFGNNMPMSNHYNTPSRKPHHQKVHHSAESQKKDYQSQEGSGGENIHNTGPKSDKTYRWAPYPSTTHGDISSQSDVQTASEKMQRRSSPEQSNDRSLNASRPGFKQHPDLPSRLQPPYINEEWRRKSFCPSKTAGITNRLSQTTSSISLSSPSHRIDRSTKHNENKFAANPDSMTNVSRSLSQDSVTSKDSKHSHSSSHSLQADSFGLEQERMLTEMLRKARETLLNEQISDEKASSEGHLKENDLHIKEDKLLAGSGLSRAKKVFKNKGKSVNVESGKEFLDRNIPRQSLRPENTEQSGCSSKETNLSVQSLQVSTSTIDRDDEKCGKMEEDLIRDEVMLQAVDESLASDNDGSEHSHSLPTTGSTAPPLNKLALPASLKRDLNRHISTKGKGVAHEPNLNIARRIRNVSGPRKSENEKDSSLKPTLRQLIGSSAARRNVNWDQVYQEVNRKKQEQGKGLPRFGIEMVPNEPEGPSQMKNDNVTLYEGFHWDSLVDFSAPPASPRKRSMSESSVVTKDTAPTCSLLKAIEPLPVRDLQESFRQSPQSIHSSMEEDFMNQNSKQHMEVIGEQKPVQDPEPVDKQSSVISSAELSDLQSGGKKRRAVGDDASPEIPNLERKNKRLKIKSKREHAQFDELLVVSLREEVLNNSLQAVDNSLIQARAALQAAYIEVQRLLLVKQQVTTEMSSLRSKRIEILQGLQDGFEFPQKTKSFDENPTTSKPSNTAVSSPNVPPSPASSPTAVAIKQERLSPVALIPTQEPIDSLLAGCHSTNSEPSAATPTETGHTFKCSLKVQVCQKDAECFPNGVDMSTSTATSHRLPMSPVQQASQAVQEEVLDLHSPLIPARFSSNPASPKTSPPPTIQEVKAGKRVKKLKKKRVLRTVQGSKQSDISDSELDTKQPTRPQHKVRTRRRPSNSSSLPPATEEKEENMEVAIAQSLPETKEPAERPEESQDFDSSDLEMVELPQAVPIAVVNLDSSDLDEGTVKRESSPPFDSKVSAHENTEGQKLACNEVTSTSEIDIRGAVTSCESVQKEVLTNKEFKTSSADASSDPGNEDMPSEGFFEGHQEAVNCLQIHNGLLFTCSGDRTVRAFNLTSRNCVAMFEGHSSKVNCLVVSSGPGLPLRLYSGSSDQTIRCYNIKTRECVRQLSLPDRVLCLHNRWKVLFAGLGNGSVVTFSLKNNKQLDMFECHGPRAVSCLATAQEGARRVLLVGSYDTTISVRDAKSGLLLRTLQGHTKTVLCMKVVNDLVFSGSSDQCVHAHNIHTGELVRIYKGHSHAVTVVSILGKVMVTACLDKLVRVYDLQSHDRLQVYGGHSDMVLCMVIHKSMIYTGCYNGSVQAVRLNLIQNYRCWWHGCSLLFGVMEHLQQHLLNDHIKPSQQTLKCRWRNCDSFFTSRNGFRQAVHTHMQKHAEEDSKLES